MIHVQTGNMLDVVVEGKSLGLKQRDSDHRKHEVIWLPEPEGLRDVLAAEIRRLYPNAIDPIARARQEGIKDAIEIAKGERNHQTCVKDDYTDWEPTSCAYDSGINSVINALESVQPKEPKS